MNKKIILVTLLLATAAVASKLSIKRQNLVRDLKLKALTSTELSDATFDEPPNLFSLYETLVQQRFAAKSKNDQNFLDFRKVHQHQAIKNATEFFKDVFLYENVDIKELDIIINTVNWTAAETADFDFIGRDLKFHDRHFVDFFIAEYFYDSVLHPVDSPSDDEMMLRLLYFFDFFVDRYKVYNPTRLALNEFIMSMIEAAQPPMFSNQIRMLMKFNFQFLFNDFVVDNLDFVEKLSKVFRKDEDILESLWGIDDEQPLLVRALSFSSSVGNICDLKKIFDEFFEVDEFSGAEYRISNKNGHNQENQFSGGQNQFSSGNNQFSGEQNQFSDRQNQFSGEQNQFSAKNCEIPKSLQGKNQLLNILYQFYRKGNQTFKSEIVKIFKLDVGDEILVKLNATSSFSDFVDAENFSLAEKREFYRSKGTFFIEGVRNGENVYKEWNRLEKYFSRDELKDILTKKDSRTNQTILFLLTSHQDESYVDAVFNLTENHLNNQEIVSFLSQRQHLTNNSFFVTYLTIVRNPVIFKKCWNFVEKYLSHDEQHRLLFANRKSRFFDDILVNLKIFKIGIEIFSKFRNDDEIRDIFSQPTKIEFSPAFNIFLGYSSSRDFIDYFEGLFRGKEEKLKDVFGMRNVHGYTGFKWFETSGNDKNFKALSDLAKKMMTAEEFQELFVIKDVKY